MAISSRSSISMEALKTAMLSSEMDKIVLNCTQTGTVAVELPWYVKLLTN